MRREELMEQEDHRPGTSMCGDSSGQPAGHGGPDGSRCGLKEALMLGKSEGRRRRVDRE